MDMWRHHVIILTINLFGIGGGLVKDYDVWRLLVITFPINLFSL